LKREIVQQAQRVKETYHELSSKNYCPFRSLAAALFGDPNVAGMVELRVPPHVVEVTVNHIGGARSGVAGTYNRSELMDERKGARMLGDARSGHCSATAGECCQPATKAEAKVTVRRLKIPEEPRALTREECIVQTVLGIIGGATVIQDGIERQIGPHDIQGVLYHLREACLATQRIRARQSKPAMRAVKQLSAALRRANRPKGGLPEDIRLVLGLDRMIHHLAAYGKAHRKPKPDAIRKRLAADYALELCERFGVKITTARTGKLCLVAAALFGDEDVDLQYHCMKAISQKPAQE
jgi:hypothetical protein